MLAFPKRLIYTLSNKVKQIITGDYSEKKATIDFSRTKKSPFNIKSESSYNAYQSNGSFVLGLKKSKCIAWIDIPEKEYQDHVIEARFRLDSQGGYAAAGVIFRIMDEDSYYLALVSSKGYFRFDAVKNNCAKALIAWTEIPDYENISGLQEIKINLNVITYGTYLIFTVNGKWLGETNDDSIASGRLGFALASYIESNEQETEEEGREYICKAMLDYISVDTRLKTIEDSYKKWTDDSNINAEFRLRLAETFAVMDEPVKSIDQINRAWKRRDEVIRTVSAATSEVRTKKELLLAARMSLRLGQYSEAEKYINAILDQWPDSDEGKVAYSEKLKILNRLSKFAELKEFMLKNQLKINKDIEYYSLLARCYWELKEYSGCAGAWDTAFNKKSENGVYAANAASAYELAGNNDEALVRYICAGKIFLNQDNTAELEVVMPKLAFLGGNNWEARSLAGKWAFRIEDYKMCEQEFSAAEKLRNALKPRPKPDPAVYYLLGLINYLNGKKKTAIRMLEKAVKLAPDYELFRTKLNEFRLADVN